MLRTTSFLALVCVGCGIFLSSEAIFQIRLKRDENSAENAVLEIFNNCKCVNYYQCDKNNNIITDGKTIIDVRTRDDGIKQIVCKGGLFSGEFICCKLKSNVTSDITKSDNQDLTGPSKEVSGNKKCGTQKTLINVRVFTGEDELTPQKGEFPWITAIFKKQKNGTYKFYCSGSLINPKVVLTANHYVHRKKPENLRVILNGKIELPNIGDKIQDERHVLEIIHHPSYNGGGLYNDVAMLILSEPYVISKENFVNTLCLPSGNENLENNRCLVAGWGKDEQGQGKIMKKVEVPFVNFNKCQDLLRTTRLGTDFELHQSFMCAGGEEGKDACKGDGGSPLMCPQPSGKGYFQAGIVSWGIGCGKVDVPGVYGNVMEFKDWITDELANRHLLV